MNCIWTGFNLLNLCKNTCNKTYRLITTGPLLRRFNRLNPSSELECSELPQLSSATLADPRLSVETRRTYKINFTIELLHFLNYQLLETKQYIQRFKSIKNMLYSVSNHISPQKTISNLRSLKNTLPSKYCRKTQGS